jgi:transcriptional regulator with XRE-family HTH domain
MSPRQFNKDVEPRHVFPPSGLRARTQGYREPRGGQIVTNEARGSIRKRRAGVEDAEIGRKIRALRLERGLSQSSLAAGIGLTFQQVQKYGKGTNRVSAGRLQKIAEPLEVPVTFFYGATGPRAKKPDARKNDLALVQTKGAMRLLRAYADISSRATKYALVILADSLRNKERTRADLTPPARP